MIERVDGVGVVREGRSELGRGDHRLVADVAARLEHELAAHVQASVLALRPGEVQPRVQRQDVVADRVRVVVEVDEPVLVLLVDVVRAARDLPVDAVPLRLLPSDVTDEHGAAAGDVLPGKVRLGPEAPALGKQGREEVHLEALAVDAGPRPVPADSRDDPDGGILPLREPERRPHLVEPVAEDEALAEAELLAAEREVELGAGAEAQPLRMHVRQVDDESVHRAAQHVREDWVEEVVLVDRRGIEGAELAAERAVEVEVEAQPGNELHPVEVHVLAGVGWVARQVEQIIEQIRVVRVEEPHPDVPVSLDRLERGELDAFRLLSGRRYGDHEPAQERGAQDSSSGHGCLLRWNDPADYFNGRARLLVRTAPAILTLGGGQPAPGSTRDRREAPTESRAKARRGMDTAALTVLADSAPR